ncbi:MAG: hypothetical protein OJF51_002411 [Nitrospira sp.]|jgi:hypothetical protein|nr:MAG: hypothetical protein OJF51_002411 [Nitrospira sp.]
MISDPASYIERLDAFPDGSGRSLVTLTAQGQADTETWLPLDVHGDVAQQHADLAKRVHRLMKIRVRRYLNALASVCEWQACARGLSRAIGGSGYDMSKLHFREVLSVVDSGAHACLLATCSEAARVAGCVTAEEVARLLRHEPIDVVLDPRPLDVAPGPPIVLESL